MFLNNCEIINSKSIAKYCDHIFAENIVIDGVIKVKFDFTLFDKLKPGDSIFTKTDFLPDLIRELSRHKTDVKIVTHESDYPINDDIVNLLPKNVFKIFSINAHTSSSLVTQIPLGIANDYCKITIKPEKFCGFLKPRNLGAIICCNTENNKVEREPLYKTKWDDEVVLEKIMCLDDYSKLLDKNTFVFCPEGNGLDTHRLWESLYLGKIPIVKKSIWNTGFRDLPILFLDNFVEANKNIRESFLENLSSNDHSLEKIDAKFWGNLIKK